MDFAKFIALPVYGASPAGKVTLSRHERLPLLFREVILATGIAERLERELGYNVLGDPVPWLGGSRLSPKIPKKP